MKPKGSASLAAVLSAFIPTWVVGLAFLGIFVLVRRRFPIIYSPRTFLGAVPEKDRIPSSGSGYLDWLHTMRKLPDKFLLYHESLDAYLYLRFLRTIIFICAVGCVLTWPILFPVNATGGGSSTELDRITISNVAKTNHLYAHAIMAWVFLGFVMFTVTRERLWLIGLRQAWTLSTSNAKRLSSRTVLFLSAPRDALEQDNMARYFGDGAVRIWPVTKPETLETLVSERDALVEKLESAEAVLIHKANSRKARGSIDGHNRARLSYYDIPDLVKMAIRLRSKPKVFPFSPFLNTYLGFPYSKKEDTIQSLRDKIKEKEELIEGMRKGHQIGEPHGAAAVFVEFKTQVEAQRACQQVASSNPLALMPRYIGVKPNEVIWDNLTIPTVRRISQQGIANLIVTLTIIFWSIPSGLVGVISNISYLAENVEWLHFLNGLPDPVIGLLSGLLPPLLTSLLSKDIPIIFRKIFKSFGGPTTTVNELKVQKWAYVFQVTQVFLVTAVFSGAATVASQLAQHLQDPTAIPALLARQLPKSSNYYLTYFIVQGTTSAADNLLNYSNLFAYLFSEYLVDETPRQKFSRYTSMKGIAWGKVFPKFTNFAIIAIAYSCIAPLVLGFAAAGLSLYYFSYRYNLIYVIQPKIDTKGQAYTLALQHLLTGVYIAELALIGFFGLRKAKGPSIMTGILFFVTILYNVLMNKYMSPLEKFLPADLVSSAEEDDETTPLLSNAEEGRDTRSGRVPAPVAEHVIKPTVRFFDPHAFTSYKFMKAWIQDEEDYDMEEDEVPEYTDSELKRAYLHPALASQTPVIWMARDGMDTSKNEVRETEACGLKASDEGAWLDEKRIVHWNVVDFEKVPVWKKAVKY
ncbi:hypothetical protein O1611_g3963 [Lasiodiplodia mahajangana]|uniref:Uncharacterized protein n=1 Tax=Lasiodiplodia mahajangana TaxID=1108764 RepID=A0ACC2JQ87_9PEZI|nr:hypothetical protein O1611_g3963 [Lasiodiplodia mahajangana]